MQLKSGISGKFLRLSELSTGILRLSDLSARTQVTGGWRGPTEEMLGRQWWRVLINSTSSAGDA